MCVITSPICRPAAAAGLPSRIASTGPIAYDPSSRIGFGGTVTSNVAVEDWPAASLVVRSTVSVRGRDAKLANAVSNSSRGESPVRWHAACSRIAR